jgi:hypothetical protein
MTWTDGEVRAVRYCAAEVLRMRRLGCIPIPQWLQELNNRLELEVKVRASRSRQELDCPGAELESDKRIGAAEAAMILGWTKRTVQRRASDDGEIVGGRWIFRQSTVIEYAEEASSA